MFPFRVKLDKTKQKPKPNLKKNNKTLRRDKPAVRCDGNSKKNDLINDSKHTLPWQYGAEPVTVDDYCGTMCSIFISQTRHGRTPFAVFPKYSTRTRSSPVPLSCSFRLRLKKIKKNPSSLVTRGTRCQRSRTLSLFLSSFYLFSFHRDEDLLDGTTCSHFNRAIRNERVNKLVMLPLHQH